MNYNKYGYEMHNCHNSDFERTNYFDNLNAQEEENYGWNYYPQTSNLGAHYGNNNYDRDDNYECNCGKEEREYKQCRHTHSCFRPCFTFPCFRRAFDCRKKTNCREAWGNNCHDNDRRPTATGKTHLYFSGCIEIKNTDRKF